MDRPPTATVFIGNIPYDVTEQMLMDMFSQAGPIKSLRMVADKDSGKPKGYGFCEFHDVQTAQSAVRNLNKYEVNGRMLRVDFADEHTQDTRGKRDKVEPRGGGRGSEQSFAPGPPPGTRPIGREAAGAAATQMNVLLGNAPFTGPSQDKISTVIAGMTPMQLFEILSQMRTLCQQNHAAARSILVANPQLTKALFQAQVLLGMVKGSAPPPSSMVAAMAPPPMQAPQQQAGGPQQQQQQQGGPMGPPPLGMAPPGGGGAPGQPPQPLPPQFGVASGPGVSYVTAPGPQGGPQPVTVVGGMAGPMLIDPSTGMPYTAPPGAVIVPTGVPQPQQGMLQGPPPPQPQQPPVAVAAPEAAGPAPAPGPPAAGAAAPGGGPPAAVQLPANLAPQQAQVLQQVLGLTPAQIDALPPAQRQQVLLVRQQLGLGGLPTQ